MSEPPPLASRASSRVSLTPEAPTNLDLGGDHAKVRSTVPQCIGEYVLLEELGRGGMGVVYRAHDPRLKREVALKVMLPQFAAKPQSKSWFIREARAQAKVEHDHVVAILHIADHDGLPYIVMPLLKGMTLHAALNTNPHPPLTQVIRIGREVAEGLAAAHEKGLVHRDIKPTNIWLEGKKLRVKVLDFGLARVTETDSSDGSLGPVTREGAVVGTPGYLSPEQARGSSVDGRTDLFSLGVVLYQMTTGDLPFRGGTVMAILTALAVDNPPSPITVNPAVPPALSDLIMKLLAKDPKQRPPTAEIMAEELRAIEGGVVNTMRVIPLDGTPPVVLGHATPDPFGELSSDPETEVDATPVAAPPMPTPSKSGGIPGWAVVSVSLLALAIVGLVASQMGSKSPEPTLKESPKETPKPKPITPPKPTIVPPDSAFFNKELTGWFPTKKNDLWRFENGELIGTWPADEGRWNSLTTSNRHFRDFEISFDARVVDDAGAKALGADRSDSAFQFRTAPWNHGSVMLNRQAGSIFVNRVIDGTPTQSHHAATNVNHKFEEFNSYYVRVVGRRVTVEMNGVRVNDHEFPDLPDDGDFVWHMTRGSSEMRVKNIGFRSLDK